MGQLSNITTRCRHQTVIKKREIKVDNFLSKGGKDFYSLFLFGWPPIFNILLMPMVLKTNLK